MSKVKIYHNPRCSKSRRALQIIKEHGVEPNVIEYLKINKPDKKLRRFNQLQSRSRIINPNIVTNAKNGAIGPLTKMAKAIDIQNHFVAEEALILNLFL